MVDAMRNRQSASAPQLLSISEVAKLLHVHPNTVRNWTNKGMLRTYRLGSRGDRRFALDDVLEFLNGHEESAEGQSGASDSNQAGKAEEPEDSV